MQRTITQVNFINEDEINVEIETYGGEFWMSFTKSGKFKGFWDADHKKPMTKNECMGLLRKTFARIHREEIKAKELADDIAIKQDQEQFSRYLDSLESSHP